VKALPRHAVFHGAWLLAAVLVVSACGGPGANGSPSPSPTPKPTPNPHLKEPAQAETVYSTLVQRGLSLIGTNASRGRDPVAVINATYSGWPLVLVQYRSGVTRSKLHPLRNGEAVKKSDPPFTFAGLNLVIEWGPRTDNRLPRAVSKAQLTEAQKLAAELDRLIGPLAERSTQAAAPKPAKKP
jgi:hypothetical protein